MSNIKLDKITSDENLVICPKCGYKIGIMPGTPDAICKNCGYKEPCCEKNNNYC